MFTTGPQAAPLTQPEAPAMVASIDMPAASGHFDGPGTK
jgi:hypothetical protein